MAAWSRRHNGSPDKSNPKPNRQRLAPTRLPAERRDTPKPPEQLGALQGSLEAKKPPFRLKQFFELQRHLRLTESQNRMAGLGCEILAGPHPFPFLARRTVRVGVEEYGLDPVVQNLGFMLPGPCPFSLAPRWRQEFFGDCQPP